MVFHRFLLYLPCATSIPHTLESKVCPPLFFAGEVCDVDAITGGFNLQAAWTMGHVVGRHIVD